MPRYYARPPTRVPTQMRDAAHPAQAGRIVASGRHRDTREDPKSTYTTPLCSSCLRGRNPLPVREFWLPRRLPSTFTASGSHRVSTSKLRLSGGGNVHSGVHVSVVPGAIYGSTPGCDEMSICDIPKLTAAKSSLCDIARVLARIGETGGPESARGIRAIGSSPCSLLRRLLRQTGYTHKGAFLRHKCNVVVLRCRTVQGAIPTGRSLSHRKLPCTGVPAAFDVLPAVLPAVASSRWRFPAPTAQFRLNAPL